MSSHVSPSRARAARPGRPRLGRLLARDLALAPLALALLLTAGPARADLVILKDGFLLHGHIKRDMESFRDPYAGVMWAAKLDGFFMVDDKARRIIFSARQVADATQQDIERAADLMKLQPVNSLTGRPRMPTFWVLESAEDFDKNWERHVRIRIPGRTLNVRQRVTMLTPQYLRVDAIDFDWSAYHLTREFPAEEIRNLVFHYLNHRKEKLHLKGADLRLNIFRFLLQAGWPDAAEAELKAAAAEFPEEAKRVAMARDILRKTLALRLADAVERASGAGQHRKVRELLDRFHRDKVDADQIGEKRLGAILRIEKQFREAEANVDLARRFLKELPGRVTHAGHRLLFREAAELMLDHLNPDTAARLEGFVGLAVQEERDRKRGRPNPLTPEKLLAVAVSGWLMGNDSAESQVDWAIRLWQAREFILKYLKTEDAGERRNLRLAYSQRPAIDLSEVAQMIRLLPPVGADEDKRVGNEVRGQGALDKANGKPLLLKAEPGDGGGRGANYYVQLPPEYHPYRNYPVLVVLHESGGSPESMLRRWADKAAEFGYILVAPAWSGGNDAVYQYSDAEHAVVLETLRDLRRRFAVDTDRVFLFGAEEGGRMAYDVGLGHPDLFAGVIPMAAAPRWHAIADAPNAQYLPFYVVDGSADGTNPKYNREQFKRWVNRGYPTLYVEYRGRGPEWFGGELPNIFDWMGSKRRAHPQPQLGIDQFATMRSTGSRFYWVSADVLRDGCVNEAGRAWKASHKAALVSARAGAGNTVAVQTWGVKELTVWLTPALVDYDKRVTIRINGTAVWYNKQIPPSLDVLLEDFYQRGDRYQLVLAMKRFTIR